MTNEARNPNKRFQAIECAIIAARRKSLFRVFCTIMAEIARGLRTFLTPAWSRSVWSAWSLLPLSMTRAVRQREQAPRTPNASRDSVAALTRLVLCCHPSAFGIRISFGFRHSDFGLCLFHSRSVEDCQDGLATNHMIAELNLDFCVHGQVHVRPRAELNQADALAARHCVAGLNVRNDPAGEHAGDQAHAYLPSGRVAGLEAEQDVFVVRGGFGLEGAEKFSGCVFVKVDLAAYRRLLHMNVNDRKKDRDAPAFPAHELRLGGGVNHIHFAVGR